MLRAKRKTSNGMLHDLQPICIIQLSGLRRATFKMPSVVSARSGRPPALLFLCLRFFYRTSGPSSGGSGVGSRKRICAVYINGVGKARSDYLHIAFLVIACYAMWAMLSSHARDARPFMELKQQLTWRNSRKSMCRPDSCSRHRRTDKR